MNADMVSVILIVLFVIGGMGKLGMLYEAIKIHWGWALGVLFFGICLYLPLTLARKEANPAYLLMSAFAYAGLVMLAVAHPM